MITVRNLRKQALHLEKKQGDKHVLLVIPARQTATIADDEMSQDILIRSQRGDLTFTHVADVTAPEVTQ